MRQEVTRAHKGWALDSVTLHNDVLKQIKEDITGPPAVCFLHCTFMSLVKTYLYLSSWLKSWVSLLKITGRI